MHVPDDARDAVASFLQDLRRDGVDWYAVGDNVRERHLYMDCEMSSYVGDEERFFRVFRSMFEIRARARGAVERVDVRACRLEWKLGVFELRARERV